MSTPPYGAERVAALRDLEALGALEFVRSYRPVEGGETAYEVRIGGESHTLPGSQVLTWCEGFRCAWSESIRRVRSAQNTAH